MTHANVVHAYDARDIEGTIVLVMEYVQGMDLGQIAQHGGMRVADACEVLRQAAEGLQAERPRAGEEFEHARAGHARSQAVEDRLLDQVRRGPHRKSFRHLQNSSGGFPACNAHDEF